MTSFVDLENVCREAALWALRDNIDTSHVNSTHFDTALRNVTPTLTAAQLDQYSQLQRTMDKR